MEKIVDVGSSRELTIIIMSQKMLNVTIKKRFVNAFMFLFMSFNKK